MITQDAAVPDAAQLYRRVHYSQIIWDENIERLRPNTGVFRDFEMSVHLGNVLERDGRDPSSVLDDKPSRHLVSFTAAFARAEEQAVEPDPQPHDTSHGNVTGDKPKDRRERFALNADWAVIDHDNLPPELQAHLSP